MNPEKIGRDKDKFERCSLCNFCRAGCPIFYGSEIESDSPRSKAIQKKLGKEDEIYYKCTVCGYCKDCCPNKADMEIVTIRERLVSEGKETENNKKMIDNVRKYGNPFGKTENHSEDKEYYCC
jgi:Fe-S oxidoreductase